MKRLTLIRVGLLITFTQLVQLTNSFSCDRCRDADICDTVTGVFRVTGLGKGYHPVVTVPRGACYVNITELGKSSNVLALKDIGRNQYILNGYWKMDKAGTYGGVGTTFVYGKSDRGCPGECLREHGPTLGTALVQLLYLDHNPGISYTFKIAKHFIGGPEVTTSIPWEATFRHPMADRSELRETGVGYQDIPRQGTSTQSTIGGFPKFIPIPGHRGVYHRGPIFSSDFTHRRKAVDRSRDRITFRGNSRRQSLTDVTYSRGIDDDTVRRNSVDFGSDHIDSRLSIGAGTDIYGSGEDPLIPLEEYVWRLSDNGDCSRPCGGGIFEQVYKCFNTATLDIVEESNCDNSSKPESHFVVCNAEPCTPTWHTSEWSTCSAHCGEGYQTRTVTCSQRISATDTQPLDDMYCTSQKPASQKQCYAGSCYRWVSGSWGDCSKKCGIGLRRRLVQCRDDAGRVVSRDYCDQSEPKSEESCDMGSCVGQWYHSNWDDKCSVACGTGVLRRRVYCATTSGQLLHDENCDVTYKPETEKPCISQTLCGNGTWFTGPWSQCSTSCGDGIQSRHVVCMVLSRNQMAPAADSECDVGAKPRDRKNCRERDCGYLWLRSEWSECSKTCGGGWKTRSVKCVDDRMDSSALCREEERPSESDSCNTTKCLESKEDKDNSCSDKYPNCAVVVQANLCRYPYYQRKCCQSCSSQGPRP